MTWPAICARPHVWVWSERRRRRREREKAVLAGKVSRTSNRTDAEYPPRFLRTSSALCMSTQPEGESCSDLDRVPVLKDPPARQRRRSYTWPATRPTGRRTATGTSAKPSAPTCGSRCSSPGATAVPVAGALANTACFPDIPSNERTQLYIENYQDVTLNGNDGLGRGGRGAGGDRPGNAGDDERGGAQEPGGGVTEDTHSTDVESPPPPPPPPPLYPHLSEYSP